MPADRENAALGRRISEAMGADRHRLKRELERARKNPDRLTEVTARIEASIARRKNREQHLPRPVYPAELPITPRADEIVAAIRKHQVIVLSGETGSGKSTQIPKMCIQAGRGIDGQIGCTQPRRIAALSLASRVAEELGDTDGTWVSSKIRFQEHGAEDSYIKFMTDGILLAETPKRPLSQPLRYPDYR